MKKLKTPVGTIFNFNGFYWKITGFSSTFNNGEEYKNYAVIKCTKNGKEYSKTSSVSMEFVDGMPKDSKFMASTSEKVSTKGQEKVLKQKRVKEIKEQLGVLSHELNQLEQELAG